MTRPAPVEVGRAGMDRRAVHRLIRDLRRFRDAFTWTLPGRKTDSMRDRIDAVISDARVLLRNGATYSLPSFTLDGEEVPS